MIIKKFPIISILDPQLYIRKKNEITLFIAVQRDFLPLLSNYGIPYQSP